MENKDLSLTIQLELLNEDALWNIFEVYGDKLTIKQLKYIHKTIGSDLTFDEWIEVNGLFDED